MAEKEERQDSFMPMISKRQQDVITMFNRKSIGSSSSERVAPLELQARPINPRNKPDSQKPLKKVNEFRNKTSIRQRPNADGSPVTNLNLRVVQNNMNDSKLMVEDSG